MQYYNFFWFLLLLLSWRNFQAFNESLAGTTLHVGRICLFCFKQSNILVLPLSISLAVYSQIGRIFLSKEWFYRLNNKRPPVLTLSARCFCRKILSKETSRMRLVTWETAWAQILITITVDIINFDIFITEYPSLIILLVIIKFATYYNFLLYTLESEFCQGYVVIS